MNEEFGYEPIRHHKMVYPINNPNDPLGKAVYAEPGNMDIPEDRRKDYWSFIFPITELTGLLKKELEQLREDNKYLSFYDKHNVRYINSVDEYMVLDNKYFMSYLNGVNKFYNENRNTGKLNKLEDFPFPITERDFGFFEIIYTLNTSTSVLERNKYNYFVRHKRYRNEEEREYCNVVTQILTELMIKYYSILKYNIDLNDQKAVNSLMDTIKENYENHVNEANNMNYLRKLIRTIKKK